MVCFDTDKPGIEASQKVAQLFEPNKCKIVRLDHKDPNEYLKMGKAKEFVQDWWSAESYTPAGILNLAKLGDSLYEEEYCETIPYPWSAMNEKTYGMRRSEEHTSELQSPCNLVCSLLLEKKKKEKEKECQIHE
mgnify:CR=1 FL=1